MRLANSYSGQRSISAPSPLNPRPLEHLELWTVAWRASPPPFAAHHWQSSRAANAEGPGTRRRHAPSSIRPLRRRVKPSSGTSSDCTSDPDKTHSERARRRLRAGSRPRSRPGNEHACSRPCTAHALDHTRQPSAKMRLRRHMRQVPGGPT